jgi:hypothetical protein
MSRGLGYIRFQWEVANGVAVMKAVFWLAIWAAGHVYGQAHSATSITPEKVIQTLRGPDNDAIYALEKRLQLHKPGTKDTACGSTYTHVSEVGLGRWNGADIVVVSAYQTICGFQFLIPFEHKEEGWVELNPVSLGAWYDEAKVRPEAVVGDGQVELVVHGNLVDRGTGMLQKDLTIFRIVDGKLRVVLDRPESIGVHELSTLRGETYMYADEVTSRFTFKGRGVIEEFRRSTRNGRTITEVRSYYWLPDLQVFQEVEEAQ